MISDVVFVFSMVVLPMTHPEIHPKTTRMSTWKHHVCLVKPLNLSSICEAFLPSVRFFGFFGFFSYTLVWSGEVSSVTHKTPVCLFPLSHTLSIPHTP